MTINFVEKNVYSMYYVVHPNGQAWATKEKCPVSNMLQIAKQIFVDKYFEKYKKGVDNFSNPIIYEKFVYEFGKFDSKGWHRIDNPKEATHFGFFFGGDSPWTMLDRHYQTKQYFGLIKEPVKIYNQDYRSRSKLHKRPFLIYKISDFEFKWA